jgi:hypothetical protein
MTLRFHLTQVRIAVTKKTTINAVENSGKEEPTYTTGENVN